jgi:hypothetical protein
MILIGLLRKKNILPRDAMDILMHDREANPPHDDRSQQ